MSSSFDPDKPRFPQTTYVGRFRHFLTVIDPTTLWASQQQIVRANQLLASLNRASHRDDMVFGTKTVQAFRRAKAIRDSAVHPDTKEIIPRPFRMAAFVPMNVPIVAGLLNATSPAGTLFFQFINQTYNVLVNYANRNATVPVDRQSLALSYGTAVGSSCSIAMGLRHILSKSTHWSPRAQFIGRSFLPFTAVATAGALNVVLMRSQEMKTGIDITDEKGNVLGKSKVAAKHALAQVAVSRVFLPLPVLALPPLAMAVVDRVFPVLPKRVRMVAELGVITGSLCLGLPAAIALFPQRAQLPVSKVEPEFSKFHNVDYVYFNKGL